LAEENGLRLGITKFPTKHAVDATVSLSARGLYGILLAVAVGKGQIGIDQNIILNIR
jgi:hypothetical protein